MKPSKAERSRNMRYKRPALASMGAEFLMDELDQIREACADIHWFTDQDDETLLNALDGDEEDTYEFRMAFSDLEAKAEHLNSLLYELRSYGDTIWRVYDDCTVALITGYLYFVPRTYMEKVDVFEEFINLLGGLNRKKKPLMVNSFYIIDDEKQRDKMTEEFYSAVKKEIADCQERADYFIQSGCQSPAIMERWVLKIQGLEERKRHYEQVLRRELDGLDDEFGTLKFLGQELQARAKNSSKS